MNNNLINYKQTNPYKMIFLVVLYAIGATSLPYLPQKLDLSINLEMSLFVLLKTITIIYSIYLMFSLGYKNLFKLNLKSFFKTILLFFPCVLVCINNFPFVAIISTSAKLNFNFIRWVLYFLVCLSIAVFEECLFRGIIYPILQEKTTDFKAVIFSSLIFAGCHLANAFSINFFSVILQIGYTFLIGALCAVVAKKSKSIYFPILLHCVYDIGGLLTTNDRYCLISGDIWDIYSIVITAVLGVFTFVYTIIVYFKGCKNESCNTKS